MRPDGRRRRLSRADWGCRISSGPDEPQYTRSLMYIRATAVERVPDPLNRGIGPFVHQAECMIVIRSPRSRH